MFNILIFIDKDSILFISDIKSYWVLRIIWLYKEKGKVLQIIRNLKAISLKIGNLSYKPPRSLLRSEISSKWGFSEVRDILPYGMTFPWEAGGDAGRSFSGPQTRATCHTFGSTCFRTVRREISTRSGVIDQRRNACWTAYSWLADILRIKYSIN